MSFQPVITLDSVPRDSKSFTFKDATIAYPTNATGWGAPNAPTDVTDISSIWAEVQGYGEEPVQALSYSGDLTIGLKANVIVSDGVDKFYAYYGEQIALVYSVASDRMSITSTDPDLVSKLDSVIGLSANGEFPARIASIVGTTVYLASELPGVNSSGTTIVRYWSGFVQELVLVQAECALIGGISTLPVRLDKCDHVGGLVDQSVLIDGAKSAYARLNYSRAHEIARLLSGRGRSYSSSNNCQSCG